MISGQTLLLILLGLARSASGSNGKKAFVLLGATGDNACRPNGVWWGLFEAWCTGLFQHDPGIDLHIQINKGFTTEQVRDKIISVLQPFYSRLQKDTAWACHIADGDCSPEAFLSLCEFNIWKGKGKMNAKAQAATMSYLSEYEGIIAYLNIPSKAYSFWVLSMVKYWGGGSNMQVAVEKPFGSGRKSLEDAIELHKSIMKSGLPESNLHLTDHWLSFFMVKHLPEFRQIIESKLGIKWSGDDIEKIVITQYEKRGFKGRGSFIDGVGQVRDMVQSHLLQVLALLLMDSNSESISQAKLDVLSTLHLDSCELGQLDGLLESRRLKYHADFADSTYARLHLSSSLFDWNDVKIVVQTGKAMGMNLYSVDVYHRWGPGVLTLDIGKEGAPGIADIKVRNWPLKDASAFPVPVPGLKNDQIMSVQPEVSDAGDGYILKYNDPSFYFPRAYASIVVALITNDYKNSFVTWPECERSWRIVTGSSPAQCLDPAPEKVKVYLPAFLCDKAPPALCDQHQTVQDKYEKKYSCSAQHDQWYEDVDLYQAKCPAVPPAADAETARSSPHWATDAVLPALLMAQAIVVVRVAYLLAGWSAMDFQGVALVTSPGLWAAQRQRSNAWAEACQTSLLPEPTKVGTRAWLKTWTRMTEEVSLQSKRGEALALAVAGVVIVTTYIMVAGFAAPKPLDELWNAALLVVVDAAFVSGGFERSDIYRSALLVLAAHLVMCSGAFQPVLRHAIVVLSAGLRLGFLAASAGLKHGLSHEARLHALRCIVAWGERPTPHHWSLVPGPRMLWLLILVAMHTANIVNELDSLLQTQAKSSDGSAWQLDICLGTWQQRAAHTALPALVLGLMAAVVYNWLERGRHESAILFEPTSTNFLLLIVGTLTGISCALAWSLAPAVLLCERSVWESLTGGLRSASCSFLGFCAASVFYGRWRRNAFQADAGLAALGVIALLLLITGSPFSMNWLYDGPSDGDEPCLLFIATLVQGCSALVVWRSFFGTGHSIVPMAWAGLLAGASGCAAFTYIVAHLHTDDETFQDDESVWGKKARDLSIQILFLGMGPPFLFLILLKGAQLVELARVEAGGGECEDAEVDGSDAEHSSGGRQQRALREGCALQLAMLLLEALALVGFVAVITKRHMLLCESVIFTGHLAAGLFQWEYLVSPRKYPLHLAVFWVGLYFLCIGSAIFFGLIRQNLRLALVVCLVATEGHLGNLGLVSHARSQLGLSRGVRSTSFAYDALNDRVTLIWGAHFHPLAWSVAAGCAWTLLVATWGYSPALCVSAAVLRVGLFHVWQLHFEHQCDVPAWFAHAMPSWLLDEGIGVWDNSHMGEATPTELVRFMEDHAAYVKRLKAEAASDSNYRAAAIQELTKVQVAEACNVLLWELRVCLRLQGSVDCLSSELMGLCAAQGLGASDIDEVLCLDEAIWQKLRVARTSAAKEAKQRAVQLSEAIRQNGGQHAPDVSPMSPTPQTLQQDPSQQGASRVQPQHSSKPVSTISPSLTTKSDNGHVAVPESLGWIDRLWKWLTGDIVDEEVCKEDRELEYLRSSWQEQRRQLEQGGANSFTDRDFPAQPAALGSAAHRVPGGVRWMRPSELFAGSRCVLRQSSFAGAPRWQAVDDRPGSTDGARGRSSSACAEQLTGAVNQGMLGDCWLLSAMSALCTRPLLLEKLFLDPPGSSCCGAYCFRLFDRGRARSVIVDDLIPCGETGIQRWLQPIFARPHKGSNGEVVLWPLLLEKAFAKLHGSYGAIEAGQVHEALMDMTGGLGEILGVGGSGGAPPNPDSLWAKLSHLKRAGHLLTAGSQGCSDAHISPRGIVQAHAYSILQVRALQSGVRLLKLRNPWGTGEWRGDYGVGSPLWTPELRAQLRWSDARDGVIWMTLSDFMCEFECIYICRIFKHEAFERHVVHGSWQTGPVQVVPLEVHGSGMVCLQLQQDDVRGTGVSGAPIRLEVNPAADDDNPFQSARLGRKGTPPIPQREVALELELYSGRYEVAAQICGPRSGEFTVTVFSNRSMRVLVSAPRMTREVRAPSAAADTDFGLCSSADLSASPANASAMMLPPASMGTVPTWATDTSIPVRVSPNSHAPPATGSASAQHFPSQNSLHPAKPAPTWGSVPRQWVEVAPQRNAGGYPGSAVELSAFGMPMSRG